MSACLSGCVRVCVHEYMICAECPARSPEICPVAPCLQLNDSRPDQAGGGEGAHGFAGQAAVDSGKQLGRHTREGCMASGFEANCGASLETLTCKLQLNGRAVTQA